MNDKETRSGRNFVLDVDKNINVFNCVEPKDGSKTLYSRDIV